MSKMQTPNTMAGMGSVWDDITATIGEVVKSAPSYYSNKEQAKRELAMAEDQAKAELERAQLQIQREIMASNQALQIANAQANANAVVAEQRRLDRLQRDQMAVGSILSDLSGNDKMLLGVAALLGLGLFFSNKSN